MGVVESCAGFDGRNGGILCGQHEVINVGLRPAEVTIDGKGACDVRGVTVELATGVNQNQVAIGNALVVLDIVQHTGVRTGGDDGGISRVLAAVATEFMQQFSFDLVFEHARASRRHGSSMRPGGNRRGTAHGVDFGGILDQTHFVDQGTDVANRSGGMLAGACLAAHRIERGGDARIPLGIESQAVPERRLVGE